jgi:hypothetical protein
MQLLYVQSDDWHVGEANVVKHGRVGYILFSKKDSGERNEHDVVSASVYRSCSHDSESTTSEANETTSVFEYTSTTADGKHVGNCKSDLSLFSPHIDSI